MAGLFPGIANSQNVDLNGKPLANALLTVYDGGTLNLSSCYQDIGLSIAAQNPMTADLTGRLPIFYVNDGTYRVILNEADGTAVFDFPQVAAIGAAGGGGGGSAVDASTIFQTGDLLWLDVSGARSGWVRDNNRTIGSAVSGASERANADCQNLFLYGWAKGWTVVSGAGVTAAADWAANKQITLPDKRGFVPGGLDDMGNTAAGRFSGVPLASGAGATTPGSVFGQNVHFLTEGELPIVGKTPAGTISTSLSGVGSASAPQGVVTPGVTIVVDPGATYSGVPIGTSTAIIDVAHGLAVFTGTAFSFGGGNFHNTMQQTVLGTFYRKL